MVSKILKQKGKGKNADPPAPTPPTPDKGVTGISLDVGDLLPPVRFGKVGGKSPILCGKQLAEKLILFDKINGVRMKASKVTREIGLTSPSYVSMIRQNIDALLEMYEIIEDCNLGFNPAVKIAQFPSDMRRDLAEKISGGIITSRSLELVIGRFREKKGRGRDKEKDLADLNALMRQYGIA
ncbi:MAG: hypothetical protein Q8P19_02800 [bacterium]|nr:hypothetical protein [bacterium]